MIGRTCDLIILLSLDLIYFFHQPFHYLKEALFVCWKFWVVDLISCHEIVYVSDQTIKVSIIYFLILQKLMQSLRLSFLVMMVIWLSLSRLNRWKFALILSVLDYLIYLRTSVSYSGLLAHWRLVTIVVSRVYRKTSRFRSLWNLRLQGTNFTGLRQFGRPKRMWRWRVWVRRECIGWLSILLSCSNQCWIPWVYYLDIMLVFNEGVKRILGDFIDFALILLQRIILRYILMISKGSSTLGNFTFIIFLRVDSEPRFRVWNLVGL